MNSTVLDNIHKKQIVVLGFSILVLIAPALLKKIGEDVERTASAQIIIKDGMLIKSADRNEIYRIIQGKRKHVPNPELFNAYGLDWSRVLTVSRSDLEKVAEIRLIRATGDTKVYYIDNGQKREIANPDVVASYNLTMQDVFEVDPRETAAYPRARLLKVAKTEEVYYITETGLRRHIPNPTVFESYGNKWEHLVTVNEKDIQSYSVNNLVYLEGKAEIYLLGRTKRGTEKRWVKDPNAFSAMGFGWGEITPVNNTEFTTYATSDPITKENIISEPVIPSAIAPMPGVSPLDQQNIDAALAKGTTLDSSGNILLKNLIDYQILYIRTSNNFLVSILNKDFESVKLRAEADFIGLLNIRQNTACALKTSITTPAFVNPTIAGQEHRLSFCP